MFEEEKNDDRQDDSFEEFHEEMGKLEAGYEGLNASEENDGAEDGEEEDDEFEEDPESGNQEGSEEAEENAGYFLHNQGKHDIYSDNYHRIDVNLPLLQTRQPTEFYGFSYPEPNPSLIQESLAFSFIDYEDMRNIKARHYPVKHQFLNAAYEAFDKHYGFVLSPGQLYLLILQQVSMHIQQNMKKLHSKLYNSEHKQDRNEEKSVSHSENPIILNNIPLDAEGEEWNDAIRQIRDHISESNFNQNYINFCSLDDFSSSNVDEQISAEMCLFDICEEYQELNYLPTLCGIPYFILDGSVEEWILLKEKAQSLVEEMTLESFSSKWLPALLPVLNKLIVARQQDEIDLLFWKNFFKKGEKYGSGAYTYISGWINVFFPMTGRNTVNPFCQSFDTSMIQSIQAKDKQNQGKQSHRDAKHNEKEEDEEDDGETGLNISEYPLGIAVAPLLWNYSKKRSPIPLQFYSGFIGCLEKEDCLKPVVGWWINKVVGKDENYQSVHKEFEETFASSSKSFH
jgi:hypothetical protein